ncbi:DUF3883 domain-containing protein [[Acidovorax] ebreus]|uniref:DUF3883 domain-containing protein n=1 Tax=Diaphorobacter sp. LI3 TaxID=2952886 RepID=UPI002050D573|nr:DUF3883 domain-containing protein [Diaphorobacter sp. LI3]
MAEASNEPLLTMSAFWGLVALRRYAAIHPNVPIPEAAHAVRRLSADDAHHDYGAATTLYTLIPNEYTHEHIAPLFRETISSVVKRHRPWWTRLAPLGRERLRAALNPNEAQCFEAAGLFVDMPTAEVLAWWDGLAQVARARENDSKLQQGREAEQLTLAFERKRLARLGIERHPKWIAIEDNTAGYDVQSYDTGLTEPVSKLIEVKSCSRELVQIFITRNEWETAISSAPHYQFHVWLLPEKKLIELSVNDIAPHIPQNQGHGIWQSVGVTLHQEFP